MGDLGISTTVALFVAPVVAFVLLRWAVRRETDNVIARLIVLGFFAKLAGTAAYYLVVAEVWGGGDVARYVREGRSLIDTIRSGTLPDQARETGTPFMDFLAGAAFAVVGPNEIAGYLVFSMLSFVGMYLFLQAFKLAVPDGNHRRYAFLLLLLPTMLFWPSTIGKEAWMVFTMGAAAFGAALVLHRSRFGLTLLTVSLLGVAAIRPHMALLIAVAFSLAYALRIADRSVQQSPAVWAGGLVVVLFITAGVASTFSDEMGRGEAEGGSLTERVAADTEEIFERADRNTRRGGGEFDSRPVRNPVDFVHAAVTVPFRPLITEAHNNTAVLSSLESSFLLLLLLLSIPSIALSWPSSLLRRPYVVFAGAFTGGFIVAFSNVGNFGLLVRYRAMLLPFLLVLLCLQFRKTPADGSAQRSSSVPVPVLRHIPAEPQPLDAAPVRDEPAR